jgi:hypothetical protein
MKIASGIYADLTKFKHEIEGFLTCLHQSCESYTEARQYLEKYLENIGNKKMEITTMASVGTGKTLPKGISIQNVISKMRLLWSATTTSPAIVAGGMSDIDNNSPPNIQRDGRTIIQKHPRKI